MRMDEIARQVLAGGSVGRPEARSLIEAGRADPQGLLYWAGRLRQARFGEAVGVCAIIAGKLGGCTEDCKFCAQSARHAAPQSACRRASAEDVVAAAGQAAAAGASCLGIVNSGRRPSRHDLDEVVAACQAISAAGCDQLRLGASLGELTESEAGRLAAAGVQRYNHNLETSRRFYPQLVSTHGYEDRLRTLAAARQAGMSLCCGGIFGAGETWDDRIDLALTLRDQVRPDVVSLNFLHPIPGTPLADAQPLPAMEVLTIIAIFRFILPQADLKIAGGRQKNLRDLQSWIFQAGASSCLIGNCLTTRGPSIDDDLRMIADLGLTVTVGVGGPSAPGPDAAPADPPDPAAARRSSPVGVQGPD